MTAAVTGLSPVIITVRIPIRRSSSKRSFIPPLTMSFRWTTPSTQLSWATTRGVPPDCATPCTSVSSSLGRLSAVLRDEPLDRVGGTLAQAAAVEVDAAHARRGREGDELVLAELLLAQPEALLGEHDDRATFGRLVGERRELRGLGEVELVDTADGQELGRLPVAERDRPGLVEQEHVDVAGGLDRAARHRQDVALHEPVHPRDADCREQRADRRRDQGDEESDEDRLRQLRCPRRSRTAAASPSPARNVIVRAARRMLSAISFGVLRRSAPSTSAIMRSRKDCPGSCVTSITSRSESRRVPPVTAERSPPASRMTGADSPVIADSSTEPTPSMISPSAGMIWPASTTTTSPRCELGRGNLLDAAGVRAPERHRGRAGRAERVRLRLAAPLGDRLGEVREQNREPEPERDSAGEPERLGVVGRDEVAEEDRRRDDAADLDDEDDGVAEERPRVELEERVADRARRRCRARRCSACAWSRASPRRARG